MKQKRIDVQRPWAARLTDRHMIIMILLEDRSSSHADTIAEGEGRIAQIPQSTAR
jgi:hypothetical protein